MSFTQQQKYDDLLDTVIYTGNGKSQDIMVIGNTELTLPEFHTEQSFIEKHLYNLPLEKVQELIKTHYPEYCV